MSVEVPLLKLTALSTSLKPPVATIFLFSGSFSCPSWQSKEETNSHRFVLFLQLLIYLSHCFGIGVALLLIFTSRAADTPRLEGLLFLIEFPSTGGIQHELHGKWGMKGIELSHCSTSAIAQQTFVHHLTSSSALVPSRQWCKQCHLLMLEALGGQWHSFWGWSKKCFWLFS